MSDTEVSAQKGAISLLAETVSAALEKRGWSLRGAQEYSGVHANTVDRLKKGFPVEPESIVKLAYAVAQPGEEVETALTWLRLSGRSSLLRLVRDAVQNQGSAAMPSVGFVVSHELAHLLNHPVPLPDESSVTSNSIQEFVRLDDGRTALVVDGIDEARPEDVSLALAVLRRLIRHSAE